MAAPDTVCIPGSPGRKYFDQIRGVGLMVPNWIEDRQLRWMIARGMSLVDAYNQLGLGDYMPPLGMRPCLTDALSTKYLDVTTGQMKVQPPGDFTCHQYWDCFVAYIETLRKFDEGGRISLGVNAYVPSPSEESCIKKLFVRTRNIPAAYAQCGASQIIPWWNGGLTNLTQALSADISVSLYDVLKASFMFAQIPTPTPTTVTDAAPGKDERPELPAWAYGLIALALGYVILQRKEVQA